MKIEFYHDVICSFCFPMSYRVRQLVKKYPKLEIIHRSFALAWEEEQMIEMFGTHENAKSEIMTHWAQANQQDELRRFNIPGMKAKDFLFPTSKNPLKAAKAASICANLLLSIIFSFKLLSIVNSSGFIELISTSSSIFSFGISASVTDCSPCDCILLIFSGVRPAILII